ncbi:leucine-rich repeat domain-containing protein, partial [Liquorilactobacillus hordei]|uniref:leucine-rich repeat domain-containing protein n=1 Tax=Liquorilactobacillus hordei TaxID=468911 RepID=UPI0039E78D44
MKACYHRANKFSRGNYLAWILIIMFMSIGTITDIGLKDISTNVLIARADSDPQNMDWIDDSLQQPILNELKNEGKISQNSTTFSKNDIANMTSLDTGDQAVESLRGLEYAKNLTTLKISNDGQSNPIYDLSPLSGLTKLTTLSIANSDISDITPLTNLV